jgi:hypothetical protein
MPPLALPAPTPVAPPDQPPLPPVRSAVPPTREAIAVRPWYGGSALHALPRAIDDLTRDFDPRLYEQMQHDPQVRAALALMRQAVLTRPLHLLPGLDRAPCDKEAPEYSQAERIATFARRMLARLPVPLAATLYELGQALPQGHKVAELVYGSVTGLDDAAGPQVAVVKVAPKPNDLIAFVTDPVGTTLGVVYASARRPLVIGAAAGQPFLGSGLLTPDADGTIPNFLPRSKVAIATYDPQNGDPRGRSILRAAYNGWWWRQQVWPEYLAWLATMASPTLVGTVAEGAVDRTVDSEGTPLDTPVPAVDDLTAALEAVKNRGVLGLPAGYTVSLLQQSNAAATGSPFLEALDLGAHEIWMGITGQTRATMEAQFGSRADSGTAQDNLGVGIDWLKTWYEHLIISDLVTPAVLANYGDAALRLLPVASLGDTEQQDVATLLTALATVGYTLHDSQFPGVDAMTSMPPRNMDQVAKDKELSQGAQQAAIDRANAPPPDPAPPAAGDAPPAKQPAPPAKKGAPPHA